MRTEQTGAQQPDRNIRTGARHRDDALVRRTGAEVTHQFRNIFREVVGAAGAFTAQRASGHLVRTRRTSEAQVDPPGIEAFQGAELFRDHQWRVVGQHHPTRPDANGRCATRQIPQQHRGRGTGNAIHVVVFGDPKALVAELFDMLRQVQRVAQ
ncbi:hypothetical protein D3C87_1615970 [compost metagenome]